MSNSFYVGTYILDPGSWILDEHYQAYPGLLHCLRKYSLFRGSCILLMNIGSYIMDPGSQILLLDLGSCILLRYHSILVTNFEYRYLSNLLGHRGPGSLLSHLKKKGLAHHVVATHKNFFMARFLRAQKLSLSLSWPGFFYTKTFTFMARFLHQNFNFHFYFHFQFHS